MAACSIVLNIETCCPDTAQLAAALWDVRLFGFGVATLDPWSSEGVEDAHDVVAIARSATAELIENPDLGRAHFCAELQPVIADDFRDRQADREGERFQFLQGGRRAAGEFLGDSRLRPVNQIRDLGLAEMLSRHFFTDAEADAFGEVGHGRDGNAEDLLVQRLHDVTRFGNKNMIMGLDKQSHRD